MNDSPAARLARPLLQSSVPVLLLAATALAAQEPGPSPSAAEVEAPAAEAPAPAAPEGEITEVIPVDEAAAPPADGQTQLDTIEVTGSRIRRTDYETAQPVLVITRDDIDRSGLTSIGDILQEIPQAGSALNQTFNGFSDVGGVEVDLRNLGSGRVLVLVNGHRWVNGLRSTGTNFVDLSTVPISIIERIEVLKDGASAIYGSDAIAGVVNIVTRKDYTGSGLRAYAGSYLEEGDGFTQSYNGHWGGLFSGTSLFVDGSYTRQEAVFNADRELTRVPVYGTGVTRGSSNTAQGRIVFIPEDPATVAGLNASDPNACYNSVLVPAGAPGLCDVTPRAGTNGQTFADFRAWDPINDPYNFAREYELLTPYEQGAVYGQVAHAFSAALGLRGEFLFNRRESHQLIAASPLPVGDLSAAPFNTIYVDATNPYNPFGQDIGRAAGGAGAPLGPGSGLVARRPIEGADRLFEQTVDTLRGGLSAGGNFELPGASRLLTWDAGASYAQSEEKETSGGLFLIPELRQALGPLTGCQAPCVPMNFFGGQGADGRGTITQEMLDYVTYDDHGQSLASTEDYYANFSTELFQFFANGPVGAAFGVELRKEHYEQNPDPHVVAGTSSTNQATPTSGGYDSQEAYLELALPLLRDLPDAQEVDLSVAGRFSDYGDLGSADTYKAGLRWKPSDHVLLRGTVSTAFRAPSVGELYLGDAISYPQLIDPCSSDVRQDVPGRDDNCTADGVPPTNVQVNTQLPGIFRGNPGLRPETAHTVTAGLVYSPAFTRDLNVYFDWYDIRVDDYITVIGEQNILDRCYDQGTDNRSFCENVNRDPNTGALQSVANPFVNFAKLETSGVDVSFDYLVPALSDFGRFKLVADGAWLWKYDLLTPLPDGTAEKDPDATPGRHAPGLFAIFPRWKANAALTWSSGPWSASWSTRYVGKVRESCNDQVFKPTLRDLGLCSDPDPDVADDDPSTPLTDEHVTTDASENELKATFFHSVQAGYEHAPWGTKVVIGVNNLLDEQPPPSYGFIQFPAWEFGGGYDIPGRFPYLQLQKSF